VAVAVGPVADLLGTRGTISDHFIDPPTPRSTLDQHNGRNSTDEIYF